MNEFESTRDNATVLQHEAAWNTGKEGDYWAWLCASKFA